MYAERRAQIALYTGLKTLFEDEDIWATPFNVYERQDWSPNFVGEFPWVFVVNADPAPSFQIQHLPVIVVETQLNTFALDLGGGVYGVITFAYHIFARNGAQRDDMTGAIVKHHGLVELRDWDQPDAPLLEAHSLMANASGAIWTQSPISYSPFAPEWYGEHTRYGRIISSSFETTVL